jgi:4-alpha-glucanotransferase
MWAIFPIQDLLALDEQLRRANPQEEQINVPANPQHFWKYRLHLNVEDLLEKAELKQEVKGLVDSSSRAL